MSLNAYVEDSGTSLNGARFLNKQLEEASSLEGYLQFRIDVVQRTIGCVLGDSMGESVKEAIITALMDLQMMSETLHKQSHPEDLHRTPPSTKGKIVSKDTIPF